MKRPRPAGGASPSLRRPLPAEALGVLAFTLGNRYAKRYGGLTRY